MKADRHLLCYLVWIAQLWRGGKGRKSFFYYVGALRLPGQEVNVHGLAFPFHGDRAPVLQFELVVVIVFLTETPESTIYVKA